MLWLWLSAALAAPCDAPTALSDLDAALAAAESAWKAIDRAGVETHGDNANAALGCLDERLHASLAARYHRVEGMRAFLARSEGAARISFAAARLAEPTFDFPSDLVPDGHVLRELYMELDLDSLTATALAQPPVGQVLLDGAVATERQATLPVLVQVVDADGKIAVTAALSPGQALPVVSGITDVAAPVSTVVAAPVLPASSDSQAELGSAEGGNGVLLALGVTAGASAVAAGALYAMSWKARNSYDALPDGAAQLEALYTRTNNTLLGASIAGVVAIGTGASAVLVWKF